jgi:hypothetical protein
MNFQSVAGVVRVAAAGRRASILPSSVSQPVVAARLEERKTS